LISVYLFGSNRRVPHVKLQAAVTCTDVTCTVLVWLWYKPNDLLVVMFVPFANARRCRIQAEYQFLIKQISNTHSCTVAYHGQVHLAFALDVDAFPSRDLN